MSLTKADIFQIEYGLTKLKTALVTTRITGEDISEVLPYGQWRDFRNALRFADFETTGFELDYIAERAQQIVDDWKRENADAAAS